MKQADAARDDASSPARNSYAVTPHDTNEIGEFVPKALYVGTGGNISMQLVGDTAAVTFSNVPDGSLLPVRASIIKSTGTTASGIIALY